MTRALALILLCLVAIIPGDAHAKDDEAFGLVNRLSRITDTTLRMAGPIQGILTNYLGTASWEESEMALIKEPDQMIHVYQRVRGAVPYALWLASGNDQIKKAHESYLQLLVNLQFTLQMGVHEDMSEDWKKWEARNILCNNGSPLISKDCAHLSLPQLHRKIKSNMCTAYGARFTLNERMGRHGANSTMQAVGIVYTRYWRAEAAGGDADEYLDAIKTIVDMLLQDIAMSDVAIPEPTPVCH